MVKARRAGDELSKWVSGQVCLLWPDGQRGRDSGNQTRGIAGHSCEPLGAALTAGGWFAGPVKVTWQATTAPWTAS